MVPTRVSTSSKANPKLTGRLEKERRRRVARAPVEGNLQWANAQLGDTEPQGWVLLIGGSNLTDFRIRVAQSDARNDLLPSFWSHTAVLGERDGEDIRLYHVPIREGLQLEQVPRNNGVTEARLSQFDNPELYPNIALLNFHVDWEQLKAAIERFRLHRSLMDIPSLMVDWLAYLWAVGDKNNPLVEGKGLPSAVFVENVFGIAGLDITPGLPSRSSCPEAIWQAAKWWHDFYATEQLAAQQPPEGYFLVRQPAAQVIETE